MNKEPSSLEHQLLALLHAARDAQDGVARSTLNELLLQDPAARAAMARLMVDEQALIHRFRDDGIVSLLDSAPAEASSKVIRPARGFFSRRPLAAAAAGIAFGMFCTSLVFAFVVARTDGPKVDPVRKTPVAVFDPGMEDPTPITARNVPNRVGAWGAESARVVTAENGVEPQEGQHMLRVEPTRPDKQGKTHLSPVFQMLDLRSLPKACRVRGAEVQVTASFCAANSEVNSRYGIRIFALNQPPDKARNRFWEKTEEDGVTIARQSFDTAPGERGWHTFSLKMPLPRGTRTLVFVLSAGKPAESSEKDSVHYLDDVQVSVLTPQPSAEPGNLAAVEPPPARD